VNADNRKWLVTGATGFIGGRLCERLALQSHTPVRAMVHRASSAGMARIARLPLEIVQADLIRPETLAAAIDGCSVVVHLGLGVGRGISAGTRNILRAAQRAGVQRFIHVSSVAVHGLNPPAGSETEAIPLRPVGNVYGDEKIRAERWARRFMNRLPVTILRPGIVFGPFGQWTRIAVKRVSGARPALIDEGLGICNTLYVDNLVDAILLAAEHPAAIGETFFVTDGERVTWREYYGAYANMMARPPHFEAVSSEEVREYWRQQPGLWTASLHQAKSMLLNGKTLKQVARLPLSQWLIDHVAFRLFADFSKERVRSFLGISALPITGQVDTPPPDLATLEIESTSVQHSIDKIRNLLGYRPAIDFKDGVRLTEAWLRSAGFVV
jgi:nucleoside-diphosphate-sugar epimerase